MESIAAVLLALLLNGSILGTIIGVPLAQELTGVEAYIVPLLKFVLIGVMAGGAVVVFREMIPMARGRTRTSEAPVETEGETQ
ncbi:MAG TPA: hypothetical protein VFZ66_21845 [Herpetosiphonaceae bacterium]